MPTTTTKPKPATNGSGAARQPAFRPELFEIPIERIQTPVHGSNVRGAPVPDDLVELAASIKAVGVLSPIRVEETGPDDVVRYALVYGQRRLAAAKLAGLTHIPAIVDAHNRTGTDLVVAQLVENLQREDLNPLEEARAFRQLLDAGLTQKQLAERLGIAPSSIAHALRLLKLAEPIQEQIAAGELTASHAKAIASLPTTEQAELGRRIVEHKLSAHDVEGEVTLAQRRAAAADRARDEARTLADAAEKALLKRKGVTLETARIQAYDGDLRAELTRRGWTFYEPRASTYYGRPTGCDCVAFAVSRQYMGNNQDTVTLTEQCISQAHADAARKAANEQQAKRNAEYEANHTAEREALAAETEAIVAHFAGGKWGTTDDWRCIVAALIDPWASGELVERQGWSDEEVEAINAAGDVPWAAVQKMDSRALMVEFAHLVNDQIDGEARAKLLELAKRSAKAAAK